MKRVVTDMRGKKKIIVFAVFGILLAVLVLTAFSNHLEVTEYVYVNSKIPESFHDYRIVHLSDLHTAVFGEENTELIETVRELEPDLIVFTGDMIDKDCAYIMPESKVLFRELMEIAPVYAAEGNHEKASPVYHELKKIYKEYGIKEITGEQVTIQKGEDEILLTGLGSYHENYLKMKKADDYENKFNILLYHWTNYFERVSGYGFDLILSGHTHGGIIRIPLIGGLIGNNGELFPEYTEGFYQIGDCFMLSNRGLGVSGFPRINNNSEVILLTLKCRDE